MIAIDVAHASLAVRNNSERGARVLARVEAGTSRDIDIAPVEQVVLGLARRWSALRVAAAEAGREVRLGGPAPAPVVALLERAGFLAAPSPQDLEFWFHGERAQ